MLDEHAAPKITMLVDDQGHPQDIVRHIEEILESKQIETPDSLRDWLRRNFFCKTFSDLFRKPAARPDLLADLDQFRRLYAFELYYHNLTDQTLFTAVNDFIEPKLKQVGEDVDARRTKGNDRSATDERVSKSSSRSKPN